MLIAHHAHARSASTTPNLADPPDHRCDRHAAPRPLRDAQYDTDRYFKQVPYRAAGVIRVTRRCEVFEQKLRGTALGGAVMKNVLIVDDDPLVSSTIQLAIGRHGYTAVVADGGLTGLAALENASFDLMIVDIFMPHMRGFESIRLFHQRAPHVPLIAISGYAFAHQDAPAPDFLRMALELGAMRCLRKPFTTSALMMAIEDCLMATIVLSHPVPVEQPSPH
jgi:CheY-like chemotaxis protein